MFIFLYSVPKAGLTGKGKFLFNCISFVFYLYFFLGIYISQCLMRGWQVDRGGKVFVQLCFFLFVFILIRLAYTTYSA